MKKNETPFSDNMLKRTLTMKSVIGFGWHKDNTVAEMFIIKKEGHLITMYYNLEKIDFIDEVLEKLLITERINKPGKDPNKIRCALDKYYDFLRSGKTEKEKIIEAAIYNSRRNKSTKTRINSKYFALNVSKGAMQYKAQNHKK